MIVIVEGKQGWTKSISLGQWAIMTKISAFALIIIGILAIIFGVVGIKKAISGNKLWIIFSLLGILLAVLPLLVGMFIGAQWFKIIF